MGPGTVRLDTRGSVDVNFSSTDLSSLGSISMLICGFGEKGIVDSEEKKQK